MTSYIVCFEPLIGLSFIYVYFNMADIYVFTDEESIETIDDYYKAKEREAQAFWFTESRGEEAQEKENEEGEGENPNLCRGGAPCPHQEEDGYVDETQNPLASLLRLAKSSEFHDGEMVIRSLHETLQYVIDSPKDVKTVLEVMTSLSTNTEAVLRTDLMEQVPQIAFLCHDHPDKLGDLVTGNLVPMVVKFLTDPNDLVRKTSQAALLVLLEQELVSHEDVQDQVCPVILDLTEPDAIDYYKTEAVALMSKMAPLVGREMTERLFTQRFTRLCSDTLFQVRKVCAANFGEFSGVVGTHGTEEVLLPHFQNLCQDGVWGVRKACAEVFMSVSMACSLYTRKKSLSPMFVCLLTDDSRWVRVAAFQNLGPFISTFAHPIATDLHYNEDEALNIESSKDQDPLPSSSENVIGQENSAGNETEISGLQGSLPIYEDASNDWLGENSDVCLSSSIQIENSSLDLQQSTRLVDDWGRGFSIQRLQGKMSYEAGVKILGHSSTGGGNPSGSNSQGSATAPPCFTPPFVSSFNDDPNYNELNYWRVPFPQLDILSNSCTDEEDTYVPSPSFPTPITFLQSPQHKPETEDGAVVVEEQQRQQTTYTTNTQDSTVETSPTDDVQAELEALAASLAESIFCKRVRTGEGVSLGDLPNEDNLADASSPCLRSQEDKVFQQEKSTESKKTEVEINGRTITISFEREPGMDCIQQTCRSSKREVPILLRDCDDNSQRLTKWFLRQKTRSIVRMNPQDIVPKILLEHYISMTDPAGEEHLEDEITRHCAYSLPAVAQTLGRTHWSLLRGTFETLATDMHWKVRRTLAFSIHELAHILGEELTLKDLFNIFNGFIKDLDEVRIGVLKHLASFLKMLPQFPRKVFLPKLKDFLNPDNPNNWRFRLELAHQLAPLSELLTPKECWTHICPITFDLMLGKVVEIRRTCFLVVSHLARKLMTSPEESLVLSLSLKLVELFAQSQTWTMRQAYVYSVGQIVKDLSLPMPVVSSLLLPNFLDLASDKVPNIRLVIAKSINSIIMPLDYFQSPDNDAVIKVYETLTKLQNDPDRDVRYFASYTPESKLTEIQDTNFY